MQLIWRRLMVWRRRTFSSNKLYRKSSSRKKNWMFCRPNPIMKLFRNCSSRFRRKICNCRLIKIKLENTGRRFRRKTLSCKSWTKTIKASSNYTKSNPLSRTKSNPNQKNFSINLTFKQTTLRKPKNNFPQTKPTCSSPNLKTKNSTPISPMLSMWINSSKMKFSTPSPTKAISSWLPSKKPSKISCSSNSRNIKINIIFSHRLTSWSKWTKTSKNAASPVLDYFIH